MNLIEGIPRPEALAQAASALGGARQAALLLHTLPAADRAWMLSQLPEGQRAQMERLLAEVAELGVPADPSLVDDVVRGDAEGGLPARRGTLPSNLPAVRRLSRLAPSVVSELLQGEPDRLIAHLLRLADWPWADDVLQQLGPSRKRRVLEAVAALGSPSAGDVAPGAAGARDAALLEAFETRARSGVASSPRMGGDVDTGGFGAWWRRMVDAVGSARGGR